ncbi:sensor histidine kinase [Nocardia puris]|uniref:sensor histidine kinase n=1 Tax=Nocardia puris TaxID=208602 RepID=UPI001E652A1D|nr:nitrate- and nitrite sensing domain-containing protein [Nocardia puris]
MLRAPLGVRTRLLAIVLIPSLALMSIGVVTAWQSVTDSRTAKDWAEMAGATTTPAIRMVEAVQDERRATVLHLAGDPEATAALPVIRQNTDRALAALTARGDVAAALRPDLEAEIVGYQTQYAQLPALREGIDGGAVPADQVFALFSETVDTLVHITLMASGVAPDADLAVELYKAMHPLRAAEAISRASTLGAAALLTDGFTEAERVQFDGYIGDSRGEIAYARSVLVGARQEQLQATLASPAWGQLVAMEDAIMLRGIDVESDDTSGAGRQSRTTQSTETEPLPLGAAEWQQAATTVRSELLKLWEDQSRDQHRIAAAEGAELEREALWGGAVVLLIALLAFLAALLLANRFVGRMQKLRRDTLELADEQLPETIRKLGEGGAAEGDVEIARLEFGRDEIGQVADAFNRAHRAAVAAAVAESKTRAGVASVFLNIAHRSQVMVHRQLVLLDKAERQEENPERLDLLFQLDHLATRARRNAENLVILGGEQPGRRYRNPVPLIDVVRSAVAESLDYTRIHTGKLPDVRVSGVAVTDLIHLIAELTDNATAFSPPESRVEVAGVPVGKGIALEIIDQGLGMSEAELAERNALLGDPPDFSVATLSGDARLGLFVVAKLAVRHGISVRLTESDYGGVKAIVLVPTALLTTESTPDEPLTPPGGAGGYGPGSGAGTATAVAEPRTEVRVEAAPPSDGRPALPRRRRQGAPGAEPAPYGAAYAETSAPEADSGSNAPTVAGDSVAQGSVSSEDRGASIESVAQIPPTPGTSAEPTDQDTAMGDARPALPRRNAKSSAAESDPKATPAREGDSVSGADDAGSEGSGPSAGAAVTGESTSTAGRQTAQVDDQLASGASTTDAASAVHGGGTLDLPGATTGRPDGSETHSGAEGESHGAVAGSGVDAGNEGEPARSGTNATRESADPAGTGNTAASALGSADPANIGDAIAPTRRFVDPAGTGNTTTPEHESADPAGTVGREARAVGESAPAGSDSARSASAPGTGAADGFRSGWALADPDATDDGPDSGAPAADHESGPAQLDAPSGAAATDDGWTLAQPGETTAQSGWVRHRAGNIGGSGAFGPAVPVTPTAGPGSSYTAPGGVRGRTAEQARDLMAAIEIGTRQGRRKRVDVNPTETEHNPQEGAGDDLQAP